VQVDAVIASRLRVSLGMRHSVIVKSMARRLSLGKGDFEAIEPFRADRIFKEVLKLSKTPSRVWIRQRLDVNGAALRKHTDELSLHMDSGFDRAHLLLMQAEERDRWAG
jgi:hypothetical protein